MASAERPEILQKVFGNITQTVLRGNFNEYCFKMPSCKNYCSCMKCRITSEIGALTISYALRHSQVITYMHLTIKEILEISFKVVQHFVERPFLPEQTDRMTTYMNIFPSTFHPNDYLCYLNFLEQSIRLLK